MSGIKSLSETRDTVTLRRADFANLVEASETAQDLAAVAAHRAYEGRVGWDAARRNYLTGEETRRLLDGVSAVRVWREKRGLAQRVLAQAAQISSSYLAEIESGKKPGSADAIRRIAGVLEVPMDYLVENSVATSPAIDGPVTRSNLAAKKLAELAQTDPDRVAGEARTIVAEWVEAAARDGIRHQVRATVEILISILREIAAWVPVGNDRDRIENTGAERRRVRSAAALKEAIDVLRHEARRL